MEYAARQNRIRESAAYAVLATIRRITDLPPLKLLKYPDPLLRKVCEPITEFGDALHQLGRQLLEVMNAHQGVGLAGPQVGFMKRMFVCNHSGNPAHDLIVINPELLELEGISEGTEGCLSIPDVNVEIRRARKCRLRAQDAEGKVFEMSGDDLLARIWQHEHDHINGKLILDYMNEASKLANRRAIRHLESAYRS